MSGENINQPSAENPNAAQWDNLGAEPQTAPAAEAATAEAPADDSAQYEAWLKNNPTEQPTIERTGDDLVDAQSAFDLAYKQNQKTSHVSPDKDNMYDATSKAYNTIRGVREAREKYLQNTPEQNYELAGKFGKIESAGFDQPGPEARGSSSPIGVSRETYPQLEGETDTEYTFRLRMMHEESKRREQGDRLTDANIAEAATWKDYMETDSHDAFERWSAARQKADLAKKLHSEGKI